MFLNSSSNKRLAGIVSTIKSPRRLPLPKESPVMTFSPRLALGISAAALALGLALNLAVLSKAFGGDPMSQDIDFRNSVAGQGNIKRDTPVREAVPRDTRKKDSGSRNYGSSK